MKTNISLSIATVLVLALSTSTLAVECSTGLTNLVTNGTMQFGLRSDGANVGRGQSITLDCAAQILEIRFRMIFIDGPSEGVASLTNGDALKVTIMKPDLTPVAETTTLVTGAPGEPWLSFDFSAESFRIVPGDYIIACTTDVAGIAYFRKGPDAVTGWLYSSVDGVWTSLSSQDAMFEMSWDPDSINVASDDASWSRLKSQYE